MKIVSYDEMGMSSLSAFPSGVIEEIVGMRNLGLLDVFQDDEIDAR